MIRDRYTPQASSRGMLLGACAGISESSGVPAPVLRVATIIALCLWFKLALLAYCGTAIFYRFRR
jgi:phage shock protein PspC (stress-responsive transcriptional regulator)